MRTYGASPGATYRVASRRPLGAAGAELVIERAAGPLAITSPLLGASGALAVAAGVCVVESVLGRELSTGEATRALATLGEEDDGRLSPRPLADGTLVIDDSYNANPASMRASIATAVELARGEGRPLVLVLGEMRELGPVSASEHEALGKVAADAGARFVLAVGGAAAELARAAASVGAAARFVPTADEAASAVLELVRAGDVVLVKGSRGVATERVVSALARRAGGTP
jgi:UDP-N-acetylmuramoyl-tripeptide--D-alanyl-D-alanine ligase